MYSLTFLIILGLSGHAVNSIEFTSMEACLQAKKQVEAAGDYRNIRYTAICTPKFIEKGK
jgi:hypothetical protein